MKTLGKLEKHGTQNAFFLQRFHRIKLGRIIRKKVFSCKVLRVKNALPLGIVVAGSSDEEVRHFGFPVPQ